VVDGVRATPAIMRGEREHADSAADPVVQPGASEKGAMSAIVLDQEHADGKESAGIESSSPAHQYLAITRNPAVIQIAASGRTVQITSITARLNDAFWKGASISRRAAWFGTCAIRCGFFGNAGRTALRHGTTIDRPSFAQWSWGLTELNYAVAARHGRRGARVIWPQIAAITAPHVLMNGKPFVGTDPDQGIAVRQRCLRMTPVSRTCSPFAAIASAAPTCRA